MKIYYMIWVDGIKKMQSVPTNKGHWKFQMFIHMSMAMALNIAMIMSILQLHILGFVFYDIKFSCLPGTKLNDALSFFTLYMLLPMSLNYFFIFWRNRYKMILSKYSYRNGKLAILYIFGSYIFAWVYAIFFTPRHDI